MGVNLSAPDKIVNRERLSATLWPGERCSVISGRECSNRRRARIVDRRETGYAIHRLPREEIVSQPIQLGHPMRRRMEYAGRIGTGHGRDGGGYLRNSRHAAKDCRLNSRCPSLECRLCAG